jgi:FtsH-binding integral membrane protein
MELNKLFESFDKPEKNDQLSEREILQAMHKKVLNSHKVILNHHRKGLVLNLVFVLFFAMLYVLNPTVIFFVPLALIIPVFVILLVHVFGLLSKNKKIDFSRDIKTVLGQLIVQKRKMHQWQKRFTPIFFTICFIGGYLLGLAFRGYTIQKYQEKPIVLLVGLAMTVGFYFLARKQIFHGLEKILHPGWSKAQKTLEEQWRILTEMDTVQEK